MCEFLKWVSDSAFLYIRSEFNPDRIMWVYPDPGWVRKNFPSLVATWQSKTAGLHIATPKGQSQNYCFCKIANPEALTTAQTLTFDEKPKPQSQAPQYIGASLDRRREQQPLSEPRGSRQFEAVARLSHLTRARFSVALAYHCRRRFVGRGSYLMFLI